MRKVNRLAALLAILMMSSTMAATTYADETAAATTQSTTGSITVQNAVKGATYTAYRIFDATANGDAVSYTIPDGKTYAGIETFFTQNTNGGKTYVQLISKDNAALFNWLKTLTGSAINAGEVTCTGSKEITFSSLPYGYYYIESSLDNETGVATAITLNNSNVKAQDKSVVPGWGDGTKTVTKTITIEGGEKIVDDTFRIGETIPYEVTFKKAYNYYIKTITADGEDKGKSIAHKIHDYYLVDEMPSAVTLDQDSFVVTVNGVDINKDAIKDNDSSLIVNKGTFTLTIPWAASLDAEKNDFFYDVTPAEIVVTYNGVLTSTADLGSDPDQENNNKATFKYNDVTVPGTKEKEVYSGQITIEKVDASDKTMKLKGAKFVVIDQASKDTAGVKYLKYDASANDNKGAFSWKDKLTDATVYETGDDGTVAISGLAAGTYYLLEIEAPKGYNVLTAAQPVTLTKGKDANNVDHLLATPKVENVQGTILPSTGGMGTVAFAVVGLIVMAGAAVTLIIKKRA